MPAVILPSMAGQWRPLFVAVNLCCVFLLLVGDALECCKQS